VGIGLLENDENRLDCACKNRRKWNGDFNPNPREKELFSLGHLFNLSANAEDPLVNKIGKKHDLYDH